MTDVVVNSLPDRSTDNSRSLLKVSDLNVTVNATRTPLIEDLNLELMTGEVLALVGESGSGKSVTALALARLLPAELSISSGSIEFEGKNIVETSESELNKMRGADISMLFQQPHIMLDPTSRVQTQVSEPLRRHRKFGRRQAFSRVVELLKDVGIPSPQSRARSFSHELSGGMAQRVMIAAALAADPKLLIADEPTTALDVTVQAQILRLLKAEQLRRNLSILLITHDLAIVSAVADRIAVMYSGRIVETGPTEQVMSMPAHPYTRALIHCSMLLPEADGKLLSIANLNNTSRTVIKGCRFAPRCGLAQTNAELLQRCTETEPSLLTSGGDRQVRCFAASGVDELTEA